MSIYLYPDQIRLIFLSSTDSRTRLNRAAKVNELLVKLPNLNTLDLGFSGDARSFPTLAFAFKTFPSVSKLTLRDWPFDHDGPMSIQHQLNFATLKHLKLLYGYVLRAFHIFLLLLTEIEWISQRRLTRIPMDI